MRKLLCASTASSAWVLASAVLTPGYAADLSIAPIYKAPPLPMSSWSGSYVGISGGGAWGSAVVRNRARRLMREVFRLHQRELAEPVDLVLVARPSIAGRGRAEVEKDFLATMSRAGLLNG